MESSFINSKKVLYSFIDHVAQESWPNGLYDYARAEVRRWLGEKHASLDDIAALARSMGLTISQHQEFIDLVCSQICGQGEKLEESLLDHTDPPHLQTFSLMDYAKGYPRLSSQETAQEIDIFLVGEKAETRLRTENHLIESLEKCRLKSLVDRGRDAQERLIMGNWSLVISHVRRYSNMGVSDEDLSQEGTLGLIRAMKSFTPGKAAFSTYASYWIKKYILEAITKQGRQIPLSQSTAYYLSKIKKTAVDYEARTGQTPTAEDIARITGISVRKINNAIRNEQQSRSISIEDLSCDNSGNRRLLETIPDSQTESDHIQEQMVKDNIKEILYRVLTPMEQKIIISRFGFDDEQPKTLLELGTMFGYSKENIRLIEKKAFAKLREEKGLELLRFDVSVKSIQPKREPQR